eukprot:gene31574-53897_t
MAALPKADLKLSSKDEVYDTFLKLHPLLKETFFLQTKEDDNDPYESMQFTVVIANSSGIYGLYSYREIFEFKEFWGIGSGRSFALGAMHAVWASAKTAKEVALAGMHAGCEFDKNSGVKGLVMLEIKVPDIGDFDEVTVIELLVKVGDSIKLDQSLLTVESDKASMEIPSSSAGVVKEIRIKLGDKVKQGSVVLSLEAADSDSSSASISPSKSSVAQELP